LLSRILSSNWMLLSSSSWIVKLFFLFYSSLWSYWYSSRVVLSSDPILSFSNIFYSNNSLIRSSLYFVNNISRFKSRIVSAFLFNYSSYLLSMLLRYLSN
jgi:hypothetical protein